MFRHPLYTKTNGTGTPLYAKTNSATRPMYHKGGGHAHTQGNGNALVITPTTKKIEKPAT
jgi:hypothetical protein